MKGLIFALLAVLMMSAATGAVYACPDTGGGHMECTGRLDLKLSDQNESWRDGVSATWTAENMAPGDEFAFADSFVGLRSRLPQNVKRGLVAVTCNYNRWTAGKPDNMAKYMVLTGCTYKYSDKNGTWQINCLTGKAMKISKKGNTSLLVNRDWQIRDVDRDGKITFYDLKLKPLKNLPLLPGDDARFEISVKFHEGAGNEFQGDTFNLTMIYTLTPGY